MTLLIANWILLAFAAATLVLWVVVGVVAARSIPRLHRVLHAQRDGTTVSDWPSVTVIVPAHNEQAMIDACANGLRAQDYPNLRILFVLDRCTDDTANILARHAAEDSRVAIVESHDCPQEWNGKAYAMHLGTQRAATEWVLFNDADTHMDPRLVRLSVTTALREKFDMLSVLIQPTYHRLHEQVAQALGAIMLGTLIPPHKVHRDGRSRPVGQGPYMLVRCESLNNIGGVASFHHDVIEDLALAKKIARAGGRVGLALGDGLLISTMYDSYRAFNAGWKRLFIGAASRKVGKLRRYATALSVVGVVLPGLQLAAMSVAHFTNQHGESTLAYATLAVVLAGWLVQLVTLASLYRCMGASPLASVTFPVGAGMVARLMFGAASDLTHRRPVSYGGKQYILEPR